MTAPATEFLLDVVGLGVICSIGCDVSSVSAALREGRPGLSRSERARSLGLSGQVVGAVDYPATRMRAISERIRAEFPAHDLTKVLLPSDYWLIDAVYQALGDAGMGPRELASSRVGIVANYCGPGRIEPVLGENAAALQAGRPLAIDAMSSPRTMSNSSASMLAVLFGVRGPVLTVGMACAGGLAALSIGESWLRGGRCDLVVVASVEALSFASYVPNWSQLGASPRSFNEAPWGAMRYAAADREGISFGEGAACVLVAREGRARARARLCGVELGNDGGSLFQSDLEGLVECIDSLLRRHPGAIDYVNPSGAPTGPGCAHDFTVIERCFGDRVPFNSTKTYTGHALGLSSLLEVIHTVVQMEEGFIAPSLNASPLDPALPRLDLVTELRAAEIRRAVVFNTGLGGAYGAALLQARGADGAAATGRGGGDGAPELAGLLRASLAEVLGRRPEELDPEAPFAALGATSIDAARYLAALQRAGVGIELSTLFAHSSLAALTRHVAGGAAAGAPTVEAPRSEPSGGAEAIAILAAAGRFPGADTPEALFEALMGGGSVVGEVPPERWDPAQVYAADPEAPGRSVSRWGGFLRDIAGFDPRLFRIAPVEARRMDPQQRLLLEVAWELFERAGLGDPAGRRIGVFVGAMWSGYLPFVGDAPIGPWIDGFTATGNALSILANRLSYVFDLRGPSLVIDTACSSSLVAVHLARESLLRGECDLAIAGGVNVNPSPVKYVTTSKAGMFSPTGRCSAFAADADGMVPGEGVGLVLLRRGSEAVRAGDDVVALIRGSAVTSDGRSNGLTAPNPAAQRDCIVAAQRSAGLSPADIGYVEAHGTGTPLGDPLEIEALTAAFAGARPGGCGLGSIKPAVGHLEAAAGIVSLIKVAMALRRDRLPPSLHFSRPNARLDLASSPFYVVDRPRRWCGPRRAGVSSFGFGGTNAHVIVEAVAPAPAQSRVVGRRFALLLSARSEAALGELRRSFAAHLGATGELEAGDVCFTCAVGRRHFDRRLAAVGRDTAELGGALAAPLRGGRVVPSGVTIAVPDAAVPWDELASLWPAFAAAHTAARASGCGEEEAVGRGLVAVVRDWGVEAVSLAAEARGDALHLVVAGEDPGLAGWVAQLYVAGLLEPSARVMPGDFRRVLLPTCPFERQSLWVERPAAAAGPVESPRPTTGAPGVWVPCVVPDEAGAARSLPVGRWLVVWDRGGVAPALVERLRGLGGSCVSVYPGGALRAVGADRFAVDLREPAQIEALLVAIAREHGPLAGVISLAGCWPAGGTDDSSEALIEGLAEAVFGLGLVARTLSRVVPGAELWVVTRAGQQVPDEPVVAEAAAVLGMARSIAAEFPEMVLRCVDVGQEEPAVAAAVVLEELAAPSRGREVAVRGGRRWSPGSRCRGASAGVPWRVGGRYVITGGTGGIGLALARRIVACASGVSLVLWSRREEAALAAEVQAQLMALRRLARAVEVRRVDLSDRSATTAAIAELADEPLDGVFHLAAAIHDEPLDLLTWSGFVEVCGAKAVAALELVRGLSRRGCFVVLCGSLAAGLGAAGGSSYAAANAYLRGLATARGGVVRTVELGLVDTPLGRRYQAGAGVRGVAALSVDEAVLALEQGVRADEAVVLTARLSGAARAALDGAASGERAGGERVSRRTDAAAGRGRAGGAKVVGDPGTPETTVGGAASSRAEPEPARRLSLGATEERERVLLGVLVDEVAQLLDIPSAQIDVRDGFRDLGVDSLLGARLLRRLGAVVGVQLPGTALFEHFSIERLAMHLAAQPATRQGEIGGETPRTSTAGGAAAPGGAERQTTRTRGQVEVEKVAGGEAAPGAERQTTRTRGQGEVEGGARVGADATFESARGGRDDVAIVGMALRVPGAVGLAGFWSLLTAGATAVGPAPARLGLDAIFHPRPSPPGTTYTRVGGFLADVEGFDAELFRISPREAAALDPQQRLALEVAWHALEDAGAGGVLASRLRTGVFLGASSQEFPARIRGQEPDIYTGLGAQTAILANRISYALDLHGPSLVVDTACSSSLVALHLACGALERDECDMALALGVHVRLLPDTFAHLARTGALSPSGSCRPFDAEADGFVRGEAVAALVLKPLARAVADGDRIHAMVLGSACNNDGRTGGLSAPSSARQAEVIAAALARARRTADAVGYVEAHATGTPLGDPIEFAGLVQAFRRTSSRRGFCGLGGVKAQIGHAEAASGLVGVIKVALAFRHELLPATQNFARPNPELSGLAASPFYVVARPRRWPRGAGDRIAGVSSFGMGGSNAHVILSEPPPGGVTPSLRRRHFEVLPLSARSPAALQAVARAYAGALAEGTAPDELCAAAGQHRAPLEERAAVVAGSAVRLRDGLMRVAAGEVTPATPRGRVGVRPRVALLCTGQGAQFAGMHVGMGEGEPAFAACHRRLVAALGDDGERLVRVLTSGEGLDDTRWTQPALVVQALANAAVLAEAGVQVDAVLGHSVGEYAAAALAGVMDEEAAVRLAAGRGAAMAERCERGAMAALPWGEAEAREVIAGDPALAIAAINGPRRVVVAGPERAVTTLAAAADGQLLAVSHAFHSPSVAAAAAVVRERAAALSFHRPRCVYVSAADGAPREALDPAYWAAQVTRPVRFWDGFLWLWRAGYRVFVEVGPQPHLIGLARAGLAAESAQGVWLPIQRRGDAGAVAEAIAGLWTSGCDIDWRARAGGRAPLVDLPLYPLQHRRFPLPALSAGVSARRHPLLDPGTDSSHVPMGR